MNCDKSILELIEGPIQGNHTIFLEGPVGSGKSQALIERVRHLLASGVPGYSILVLLPDRAATIRCDQAISSLDLGPYDAVQLHTYYSLAVRLIRLFWPLIAGDVGFVSPQRPPIFLTYETTQYIMGRLIAPFLERGYFEGLSIRIVRIISQLIDNLNKAAVNGYPIEEVEPRLRTAWTGEADRSRYYVQAQECIERFRGHCLELGLLDFSLVLESFHRHLLQRPPFWRYFTEQHHHILVDNLEETVPVAQDLIRRLLSTCDSALLAYDRGGGHRVFLGVDAHGAPELRGACREIVFLEKSATSSADMTVLAAEIGRRLGRRMAGPPDGHAGKAVVEIIQARHRAEMLGTVARRILRLTNQGISPGEIAVVAPYADGVLRFVLSEALQTAGVPFRVIRRSESLREEPVARACLTFAALAHPDWDVRPHPFDVAEALCRIVGPLDPVRAALAARSLYEEASSALKSGDDLGATERERIGAAALGHYDVLREWIEGYRRGAPVPTDHFLRRFFGEILSRSDLPSEDARVCAKLIASASGFRRVAPAIGLREDSVGGHYIRMVYQGGAAAQYLTDQDDATESKAVILAPVPTYLLSGHTARFQFWLDIGSIAWWEPPHQPLTNPYVLSRRWSEGTRWTDRVDFGTRNEALSRVVVGLTQRCREGIYLCTSELEMTGQPQEGPLLRAVQRQRLEES